MLAKLKQEYLALPSQVKSFLLAAMLCSFCISAEYGASRPTSNAIFITFFSAEMIPYAWLLSIPINLLLVFLYNRLLYRLGCFRMLVAFVIVAMTINLFSAFFILKYPWLSFAHYIWKEIYILLMFKQLWSMVHSTIAPSIAKRFYGLLFAAGGIGSVLGSSLPGFLAVHTGSQALFLLSLPIYLLLFFSYRYAYQRSHVSEGKGSFEIPQIQSGIFSHIVKSRYLSFILFLVIAMQVATAFVDYQFHAFLGESIFDLDLRTQYCGRLVSLINLVSLVFQLGTGLFLLPLLGMKKAHQAIPLFLGANALLFWLTPSFAFISYSYVCVKSLDYSFFGVIREMLYVPLKLDEKFRVKAVIDVFAYRTAKAFASFLILLFQYIPLIQPVRLVTWLLLSLYALWFYVTIFLFRKSHQEVTHLS